MDTGWRNENISGQTIIYSGHEVENAPHTEGVAIMLSKQAETEKALIGWEPMNSRITKAKIRTSNKRMNLNVIICYAETNNVDEQKKEQSIFVRYYKQL